MLLKRDDLAEKYQPFSNECNKISLDLLSATRQLLSMPSNLGLARGLQVSDEILTLLRLLDTGKDHLGSLFVEIVREVDLCLREKVVSWSELGTSHFLIPSNYPTTFEITDAFA